MTLERTICYGPCPAYAVTVDRRGNLTWKGEAFVPIVGDRSAECPPSLFRALAKMLNDTGFYDWSDEYVELVTDVPSTILTVERDGLTKSVRQHGTDKPAALQTIATFIDGIAAPCLWMVDLWGDAEPSG